MNLRYKFFVLLVVYVLSLFANLAISGWCILVFFQSAFLEFRTTSDRQAEIEWTRALLRRQLRLLEKGGDPSAYDQLQAAMTAALIRLDQDATSDLDEPLLHAIQEANRAIRETARRRLDAADAPGRLVAPLTEADSKPFMDMDQLLATAGAKLSQEVETAMQRTGATQQKVVTILAANAACGVLLSLLGLVLVRRWVLQPVEDLRTATKELSHGHFNYRIAPRSRDELGSLAREINHMAATITEMQAKLVEQERLAAAGEMVARLAHNIRNPLAGIRGLAEETLERRTDPKTVAETQRRIIESVDRFEKWLRDLQTSVSPLALNPRNVDIKALVANVCKALLPLADRRNVRIEVQVSPTLSEVELDDAHFEHVLVALITNALQASPEGQAVRVAVWPRSDGSGRWELSVQDSGPGIPEAIQRKIFLPYFTTKPGGDGVGLAIANKVVRIHGGELTVESRMGHGAKFTVTMPGLLPRT